tara:strand:- start:279 stop:503 length:225 start_codon:yes stop_codon:yes gene_type:complete
VRDTLNSLKFLFIGPMIVVMLFFINVMTSPGQWWFGWAAFGIGIAWVISLFKVIKAFVLVGGLAALAAYFTRRG